MGLNTADIFYMVRAITDLIEQEPLTARPPLLEALAGGLGQFKALRNETAYDLRATGMTVEDIAEMFGVDPHTVGFWSARHAADHDLPDVRIRRSRKPIKAIKYVVE